MSSSILELAANLIMGFEGFMDRVYKCPAGIDTFGYGSTITRHPNVKFPITKEMAKLVLQEDISMTLQTMDKSITAPLNQNQTVALISFIYNIGTGNFYSSTMRKYINQLQYNKAADEFLKWCHVGKEVLPGLLERRKIERSIFIA